MKITEKIRFTTNKGDIVVGLYGEEMPGTCENFINYVEANYYTNLIFHRVIKDFMIQGGGFMSGMLQKQELFPPIKLEISKNVNHDKYVVSMARTNDPNSASSQFFICTGDCSSLNGQYAAFGKVLEGEDVVDEIENVETKTVKWFDDVPKDHVVIKKAERIKE